MLSSITS